MLPKKKRTPLVLLVFPMVLGVMTAGVLGPLAGHAWMALLLAGLGLVLLRGPQRWFWILFAGFFLGYGGQQGRLGFAYAPPEWVACGESLMDIQITRVFRARYEGYVSGFGQVEQVLAGDKVMEGKSILFSLGKWEGPSPLGEQWRVRGILSPLSRESDNRYFHNIGVHARLGSGRAVEKRSDGTLRKGLLSRWERALARGDSLTHPHPTTLLYQSLLLGGGHRLSAETLQIFRKTGTAHLFAVSGFHIAMIMGILRWMLFWMQPAWLRTALLVAGVGIFVWSLGSPPSAFRAWLMISLVLLGDHAGRHASGMQMWLAALMVMVVLYPQSLFEAGTQLSFLVVGGLLIYTPSFHGSQMPVASGRTAPLLAGLLSTFMVSWVAWMFSFPLIARLFGEFSILGPLCNPLALIPVSLALIAGVVSLVMEILGLGFLGWLPNSLGTGLLGSVFSMLSFLHPLPVPEVADKISHGMPWVPPLLIAAGFSQPDQWLPAHWKIWLPGVLFLLGFLAG